MAGRTRLPGRLALPVALVVGYVLGAVALLGVLLARSLEPAQRRQLAGLLQEQALALALAALLVLAGLAALVVRLLAPWPRTARRLAADVRLLLGANPDHAVAASGPPELADLATAVGELAARRRAAETDVAREVAAARADSESERNRLAALMADLTVAVVVCSRGGRVLLYNAAARRLLDDDPALGLGRSVFGLVDRGVVTHALERIADGASSAPVATTLRGERLLQVRVTPVPAAEHDGAGFVLVLEDTTDALQARRRRDALLRSLTESTRASLASTRAAVEAVLDYPDMEPDERRQFLEIVREESERLGAQVEGWVSEAGTTVEEGLTDMAGGDLLTVLCREVERATGVPTAAGADGEGLWLRVDSHALARALGHLLARAAGAEGARRLVLSLHPVAGSARLDAGWDGAVPDAEVFRPWLHEPLGGGAVGTAREVLERHGAEVWTSGTSGPGGAGLHLLLPRTEPAAVAPEPGPPVFPGRPEFYDFDLFDLPEEAAGLRGRPLDQVAFTVFDSETTGFQPAQGDEIVSLGAVRVVGGRLLRHETFERLVDPGRRVPAASSAVHGITTDMVRGQPPLEEVLPQFARFAEGTVLVGHNVGFDLSFLRAREERTGVRLGQPVLDTLLLDAALHPDHEEHSLEAIAGRLGVDVLGRHTALGDALLTGEVFVRMLGLLRERGVTTVEQALDASRQTYQARLDAALYGS